MILIGYNKPRVRLKKLKLRRKAPAKKLWWLMAGICGIAVFYFYFFFPVSSNIEASLPPRPDLEKAHTLALKEDTAFKPLQEVVVKEASIVAGDNLTSLLGEYLGVEEIYALVNRARPYYSLEDLRVGHKYRLLFRDNTLVGFDYEIDENNVLSVLISRGNFEISLKKIHYEVKEVLVLGTIEDSLFLAVKKAGEEPALAINLANIFGWDIDFIRDIWPGDSFVVLVEKRYRQNQFTGYGKILAAKFINQGKPFYAFYYRTGNREDYFDLQGRSLRKAFLKAPLAFSRISSGYSLHRKHPILKVVRPHQGVDYAAPLGTPIKSVGDGVIVQIGWDKAAGKFIKIRHKNGYETIYNHMSRFARAMKKGKKVKQGQVIGYVGKTGYATGPHLDFRVKKNGRYINPLTLKSPPTTPISKKEMDSYLKHIASLQPRLDSLLTQK